MQVQFEDNVYLKAPQGEGHPLVDGAPPLMQGLWHADALRQTPLSALCVRPESRTFQAHALHDRNSMAG